MASVAKTMVSPIRILIADDHALFREGLRRLLEAEEGFEVVGEAADGEMLVALARRTQADIILLDLAMPKQDGMEVLGRADERCGRALHTAHRSRRDGCAVDVQPPRLLGRARRSAQDAGRAHAHTRDVSVA